MQGSQQADDQKFEQQSLHDDLKAKTEIVGETSTLSSTTLSNLEERWAYSAAQTKCVSSYMKSIQVYFLTFE